MKRLINGLTYENCASHLLKVFPELREATDKEREHWPNGEVANHILFVDIFARHARELLESPVRTNPTKQSRGHSDASLDFQRRAFDFMEAMANSPDIQVVFLLETGILESLLAGKKSDWAIFSPYFRKSTKRIAENLAERMGINKQG